MEIILANTCQTFTGTLDRSLGYSIQRRKGRYFAKRNSKGHVPPDGHWKFICLCAKLVQVRLYFADIRVSHQELSEALSEAGLPSSGAPHDNLSSSVSPESDSGSSSGARHDSAEFLSSSDILTLKERIGL